MVYAITWDETVPTDDNYGYDLDTLIQDVKKATRERFAEEHRDPSGGSGLAYVMHEWNVVAKSTGSPYTALETDHVILVTTGASDYTINLPTAVGISGKPYKIKKVDSGVGRVIVDANGSETIDGNLTLTISVQNDFADIVSDGTNWVIVASKIGSATGGAVGHISNLQIIPATESGAKSKSVVITADSIVLTTAGGEYYEAKSVNVTLNLSASGVDGLDTGSAAVATWYFIWLIYNGTTVASLASTSATSPTMPSGYTYKKLLGAMRNIGFVSQLHMDGADLSTTFTDESGKTWTANGDAKLTTADKKYGTASGTFDGTGDWVDTPNHADFNTGYNDFTFEFWFKRGNIGVEQAIVSYGANLSNMTWGVYITTANVVTGRFYDAVDVTAGTVAETTTWHHFAMVRRGTLMKAFLDGVGGTPVAATQNLISSYKLSIGKDGEIGSTYYNGKVDEFSVVKGFAKYWEDFTPPAAALGNLCQLLNFTQIDKDVKLEYPQKIGDSVGSTTTASLSVATVAPATITKGVNGKVMGNGAALVWHYTSKTFPNSIAADNNITKVISLGVSLPQLWNLEMLEESQVFYHQVTTDSVDVWITSYNLKGI